ncbi:MAG: ABC transporter permease, partial [Actinobacteria bacterium]|nr:ABC transporter permease [Actinomycetota bacterium]
MGRYVIRRLLQMVLVLIGTTFLIFSMVYALPGDPFAGKCGDRGCPPEYIAAQRAKFGLDDPLIVQYANYVKNLLQGNFGESYNGVTVASQLEQAIPITLKLTALAITFEIIIGISAGILSGIRRNGFFDNLVLISTLVVISIPIFVIGYVLQFTLGVKLAIFPVTASDGSLGQLILPALVLGSLSLAYVSRLTRTSLAENLRGDYVRTAVAKGMSRTRVIGVHTLRNSLIPVITYIGADVGALLGGAIVTEGIFNITGIGGLTFRAIRLQEGALVVGVVTLLVLVFLLVNLLVDLLYA